MGTTLEVERKACSVRFVAAFLLLRGISCLLAYPWRIYLNFFVFILAIRSSSSLLRAAWGTESATRSK